MLKMKSTDTSPEISIVIPVYNSHECVAEISRQIADALKDFSYEQIMVMTAAVIQAGTKLKRSVLKIKM